MTFLSCCHLCVIRSLNWIPLRIYTCCGDRVVDLACVYIGLGNRVGVGNFLRALRCERKGFRAQGYKRIFECDILHRHIAVVCHNDRVGNRIAHFDIAFRVRRLLNNEFGIRFNGRNRCIIKCCHVIAARIFTRGSNRVFDFTRIYVSLSSLVGVGNGFRAFRRKVKRVRCVGLCHQSVFKRDTLNGNITAVRHHHCVSDIATRSNTIRRVRSLLN